MNRLDYIGSLRVGKFVYNFRKRSRTLLEALEEKGGRNVELWRSKEE